MRGKKERDKCEREIERRQTDRQTDRKERERKERTNDPRLHYRLLTLSPAAYWPCAPGPALAHKVSRRRAQGQ